MTATVEALMGAADLLQKTTGLGEFGVPEGGPFDSLSAAYANTITGRAIGDMVLELTLGMIRLRVSEPTSFGIVGAVDIRADGRSLKDGRRVSIDEVLEVRIRDGCRASISAAWGGPPKRVQRGDRLDLEKVRSTEVAFDARVPVRQEIRVMPGPQADLFPEDLLNRSTWTASPLMDRVGIRLDGLKDPHSYELPSEPSCFGAIQITRDGTPIILGPDGPTIGGYPKVAIVISADLSAFGQLRPGSPVTFSSVSLEEALEIGRLSSAAFEQHRKMLQVALGL